MKNHIPIQIILGLSNSIFIVDAQACEAGKMAWNNIEVKLTNAQDSRNQTYMDMRVTLQSIGNWYSKTYSHSIKILCPSSVIKNGLFFNLAQ